MPPAVTNSSLKVVLPATLNTAWVNSIARASVCTLFTSAQRASGLMLAAKTSLCHKRLGKLNGLDVNRVFLAICCLKLFNWSKQSVKLCLMKLTSI